MLVHVLVKSVLGQHRVWTDNGVDLFELIVPGRFFLMGGLFGRYGAAAYRHFTREVGGYVGLPLLLVAIVFFHARQGERRAHFLAAMFLIVYVAALGPSLHFRGIEVCPMPWKLFGKLPLINSAQAVRLPSTWI